MDGDIWKTAKGPDDKLFFDPNTNDNNLRDATKELRIGVTLGIDWYVCPTLVLYQQYIDVSERFGPGTSSYGPSHSSGCISFSIANLPPELRYVSFTLTSYSLINSSYLKVYC